MEFRRSSMRGLVNAQGEWALVRLALKATVVAGGTATEIEGLENGAFCKPTILTGMPNENAICRKEIFGSVLAVIPFENEANSIAQSNVIDYGLAAGVRTSDFERAWRAARRIDAGTGWISPYKQRSASTSFGADRASRMGREKGIEGLRARQTQMRIYADLTGRTILRAAA